MAEAEAEAVDVTGTVVAVVEIAAGEAEAAVADAISRVLSRAFLNRWKLLSCRRARKAVLSRLAGFTL
jgi:hypothetical protein